MSGMMPGQQPENPDWAALPVTRPDLYDGLAEVIGERRVPVPDGYSRLADDEGGAAALSVARELREQMGL